MLKITRTPLDPNQQKLWTGIKWELTNATQEKSKLRPKTLSPRATRKNVDTVEVGDDGKNIEVIEEPKELTNEKVMRIIPERSLSKTILPEEKDFLYFMMIFMEALASRSDMIIWHSGLSKNLMKFSFPAKIVPQSESYVPREL